MTTRMLIDAAHPEETRVVVVKGSRLEEFDMESATRKQLRGNIYLAKVTRVEPSLQAAFVDYGGNRHGFLAFSDIHPDYYQIPIADREALLEQQAAIQAAQDRSEEEADDAGIPSPVDEDSLADNDSGSEDDEIESESEDSSWNDELEDDAYEVSTGEEDDDDSEAGEDAEGDAELGSTAEAEADDDVEELSEPTGYEGVADLDEWRRQLTRRYKIQEVIKRRQILLVQVVKEERGNKGAALTTYLSLAGRYCVLMPNSTRGGGISRKITNSADRKKLRSIIEGLEVPDGMRLIVRTAGQSRNKAEIRRDFEYLLRLWNSIREINAQQHRAEPDLRRRQYHQAVNPRPLLEGHDGNPCGWRRRPQIRQSLHEDADAESCKAGSAISRPYPTLPAIPNRRAIFVDAQSDRAA